MVNIEHPPWLLKNVRRSIPQSTKLESVVIGIKAGKIVFMTPHIETAPEGNFSSIDGHGGIIMPGAIDLNVSLSTSQKTYPSAFNQCVQEAAAGGITEMAVLPSGHDSVSPASIEHFQRLSTGYTEPSLLPIAHITRGENDTALSDMRLLYDAGARAFCGPNLCIQSTQLLYTAMQYVKDFQGLIIERPQDLSLSHHSCATSGKVASELGLISTPSCSEDLIVARDIRLAECTGARLHLTQISTQRSVKLIAHAKHRGIAVTCDTSPPYFLLNEKAIEHYNVAGHLNPPLRTQKDQQAICQGLADGTIDAVSSGHVSFERDAKERIFGQSICGYWGLQSLVPSVMELVADNYMSLSRAIELLSINPAAILNTKSGYIRTGDMADCYLLQPSAHDSLSQQFPQLTSSVTPFSGYKYRYAVARCFKNGQQIYKQSSQHTP